MKEGFIHFFYMCFFVSFSTLTTTTEPSSSPYSALGRSSDGCWLDRLLDTGPVFGLIMVIIFSVQHLFFYALEVVFPREDIDYVPCEADDVDGHHGNGRLKAGVNSVKHDHLDNDR